MSGTLQYLSGVAWPWFVNGLVGGDPTCLALAVANAALLWCGLKYHIGLPRIGLAAVLLLTGLGLSSWNRSGQFANAAIVLALGVFLAMLLLAKENLRIIGLVGGQDHPLLPRVAGFMLKHVGMALLTMLLLVVASNARAASAPSQWNTDIEYGCFILAALFAWLGLGLFLYEANKPAQAASQVARPIQGDTRTTAALNLEKLDGEPL